MNLENSNVKRHPNADQLLDLVLGLAAPESRAELLDHVATCVTCETRLRDVAAAHERARARQAAGLGGIREHPSRSAGQPSRFVVGSLALAAALAVFAGLFVILRLPLQPSTRPPESAAWLPRPDTGVLTRGGDANSADTALIAGLAAYELRDLAGARRLLGMAHATGSMEQVRRVYLANTLLHMGAVGPALEQLQALNYAALPEPWRGESRWAWALALARSGHVQQADSLMRQLATEPGPVGARARAGLLKSVP